MQHNNEVTISFDASVFSDEELDRVRKIAKVYGVSEDEAMTKMFRERLWKFFPQFSGKIKQ